MTTKFIAGEKIGIGQPVFLRNDNKLYAAPLAADRKRLISFFARKNYEKGEIIEFDLNHAFLEESKL